jgi:mannose-6-phosphate isomerase-like protein (cupin superfamily)
MKSVVNQGARHNQQDIDRRCEIAIFDLMFVRKINTIASFEAGDKSLLKEILHPAKHPVDIRYSLAWATVKSGQKTESHRLVHAEVYHILRGQGRVSINNEENDVEETDTVYIPPHATQWIANTGEIDLEFLCIVDPAWEPRIETILARER